MEAYAEVAIQISGVAHHIALDDELQQQLRYQQQQQQQQQQQRQPKKQHYKQRVGNRQFRDDDDDDGNGDVRPSPPFGGGYAVPHYSQSNVITRNLFIVWYDADDGADDADDTVSLIKCHCVRCLCMNGWIGCAWSMQ
jgi:hypothetical protein